MPLVPVVKFQLMSPSFWDYQDKEPFLSERIKDFTNGETV